MNDNKVSKFENPIRIAELNPKNTLIKAGFKDGMTLCDIGAGTGIFSFPAAEISSNDVYALEISDSMLELLKNRIEERNAGNLKPKKVNSTVLPMDTNSCDMAIMVTVLHEIEDKEAMLTEIKRILKENGRLMVIEFHKRETPMGPPVDHRLTIEFVEEVCKGVGFKTVDTFSLGDNFYFVIFEKD